ncbi:GntP family permease [Fusobacterium simiae]|uniref:GntP family permease n=1 Tax=Fusobacterium simiae TaxID=855 RepID=A0ABT4DH05_FUSSI|nr:GntP family permease [Fusobacterium simiae]MCY7007873.1 GntP family permease [Fusobacterium simiae]
MINLIIFLIILGIMLYLMIKSKIGPFYCMLLASVAIGFACGLESSNTINTIVTGFSNTCKSIALLVIFGTVIGIYLERTNACQRIAKTLLNFIGNSKSSIALAITGFVISIPVFCDVALVLLSPLIKSVAKRSGKNPCALGTITACSLLSTNAYVAPTPAPLSVIAVLGLDIGVSILWGLPVAAFVTLCIWVFGEFYLGRKPDSWFTQLEEEKLKNLQDSIEDLNDNEMPSFLAAVTPILLPIILILLSSIGGQFLPKDSSLLAILKFLGDKNISLAIGIVITFLLLAKFLPEDKQYTPLSDAFKIAGPIIFITAAGGSLAAIVNATGIGEFIVTILTASHVPVILMPFLITGFSKFAQGSASVAELLAAGLSLPMCEAGLLTPLEAFLSISAGAAFGSHVNNSFFWVFSEFMGYDSKTTLKTLCVGQNIVMAFSGLFAAIIVSIII